MDKSLNTTDLKLPKYLQNITPYIYHPINIQIYKSFQSFSSNKKCKVVVLLQNPFGKNNINKAPKQFHESIKNCFEKMNLLQTFHQGFFEEDNNKHQTIFALYLANIKNLLEHKETIPEAQKYLSKKRLEYSAKIVDKMTLSKIREEMEDMLFSELYPDTYEKYHTLISFTKKTFHQKENGMKKSFEELLKNEQIEGKVVSRVKSIASIHHKIQNKNILFSQILDTLGFRFILQTEVECYKLMSLLSRHWSIVNDKIKDYIAVPKSNGYQSIHITLLYDEHPVEIQIRTKQMHSYAQFGKASHSAYKNKTHDEKEN
ncbi:hypothetical protein COB57_00790 [Candidatus Peregrinibacteria bacterium]|nr:MAG: hypothetical protein COB57_00790 [Candidatus Peregrinibacteria bacterium]